MMSFASTSYGQQAGQLGDNYLADFLDEILTPDSSSSEGSSSSSSTSTAPQTWTSEAAFAAATAPDNASAESPANPAQAFLAKIPQINSAQVPGTFKNIDVTPFLPPFAQTSAQGVPLLPPQAYPGQSVDLMDVGPGLADETSSESLDSDDIAPPSKRRKQEDLVIPVAVTASIPGETQAMKNGRIVSSLLSKHAAAHNLDLSSRKSKRKRGDVQKAKHNDAEKRRRNEMNDAIDKIKALLPDELVPPPPVNGQAKPTKVAVLLEAADYIEKIQALCCSLAEENQKLQDRASALQTEVTAMRVSEEWGPSAPAQASGTTPAPVAVPNPASSANNGRYHIATTVLLTTLFFVFWTPLLSYMEISSTDFEIGRSLLSLPSANASYVFHILSLLMSGLLVFLSYFQYVLVAHLITIAQIRYVLPGTPEHEAFISAVQQVVNTRITVGSNKAFRHSRKVIKQGYRAIPRGHLFSILAIMQQLIRMLFLRLGVGVWMERLVAKIRGVDWNNQVQSSVLIHLFHIYLDTAPRDDSQFWYVLLMAYNEALLHPVGLSIRDDMNKVKLYKTIAFRLRHSIVPPIRAMARHCDVLSLAILHNYTTKFNVNHKAAPDFIFNTTPIATKPAPAEEPEHQDDLHSDSEDEPDHSDDSDFEEDEEPETSAAPTAPPVTPAAPAARTAPEEPKEVKLHQNLFSIGHVDLSRENELLLTYFLSLADELWKSLDEGRLNDSESTTLTLLRLIESPVVRSTVCSMNSTEVTRVSSLFRTKLQFFLAFLAMCKNSPGSLGRLLDLFRNAQADSETRVNALLLLSAYLLDNNQLENAKRVLGFLAERYGNMAKHPIEMSFYLSLTAQRDVMQGDLHTAVNSLRTILNTISTQCTSQRFQHLCILVRVVKIASDVCDVIQNKSEELLAKNNKQDIPSLAIVSALIKEGLWWLGRASSTSNFFMPFYLSAQGRFNAQSGNLDQARESFAECLAKARELTWPWVVTDALALIKKYNIDMASQQAARQV